MKLNSPTTTQVEGSEDFNSGKFSISDANSAHMFRMLTTYSDPISSVVREITSNCFDAHRKAGVEDKDVIVRMKKGSKLDETDAQIQFIDFGTGLTPKQVEEIFTVLGESTKRDGNEEIGAFGIGAKSPFGYIRENDLGGFIVDTYVDGTHWEYFLAEDAEEGPTWMEMTDGGEDTDRENGTIITVPIQDGHYYKFKRAVRTELAYFDNIEFQITNVDSDYTIYRGENFVYRPDESPYDKLHACFGKVAYPLNYDKLGWEADGYRNDNLKAPIGLYFDIGEIQVTPKREQINYTDETIAKINEKVEEAQEEFEKMWDNQHDGITTIEELLEARKNSSNSEVTVQGVDIPFCDKLLPDPKINMDNFDLDLPDDIFYTMEVYKAVDQNGYVLGNGVVPTFEITINDDSKTAYYVEDSYSPKTNRFIASRYGRDIKHKFYLVKKSPEEPTINRKYIIDDPAEDDWEPDNNPLEYHTPPIEECEKPEIHRARYRYDKYWTSPSESKYKEVDESTLKEIIEFEKLLQEYVIDQLEDYSDVEVTEEFEEWEKKKREQKEKQKKKKREKEFPIKILEKDGSGWAGDSYKWKMDDMEYDSLDNSTLYIYGFQADSNDLLDIAPIIYSNDNFFKRKRYDGDQIDRNRVAVLKIAMKREYLFENLDNAMHISEFQDGHKIIDRAYHASFVKAQSNFRTSGNTGKIIKRYFPTIYWKVKEVKSFIRKYNGANHNKFDNYGVEVSDNAKWGFKYTRDEIELLNHLSEYVDTKLPLVDTMRMRKMDDNLWDEFKIYANSKDLVHPKLWAKKEGIID